MRPTRIREKEMKKEVRNGTIHLTSEKSAKFINAATALLAMQAIEFLAANMGYSTHSSIYLPHKRIELSIHFEGANLPQLPPGYKYSWRDITSHTYYSEYDKQETRVRVIDYYFEY